MNELVTKRWMRQQRYKMIQHSLLLEANDYTCLCVNSDNNLLNSVNKLD